MNIANEISASAQKAIKALYGADVTSQMIQLQKTKREFEGHLTLVVFPFLKISRKKPEDTAREIGEWLVLNDENIAACNAVFSTSSSPHRHGSACSTPSMPTSITARNAPVRTLPW